MNGTVKTLNAVSGFFDRHKVTALLLGGFLSVTTGATFWLAQGGAVAITMSVRALSDPEIAETLSGLPEYHQRVENALSRLEERMDVNTETLSQVADTLESFRTLSEVVVEWAPDHSQRLTDAVGGCYAGQPDCPIYLRGRRTLAGTACVLEAARPRLLLPDGQEFPIRFTEGYEPIQLTGEFETMEVLLQIPSFVEPGLAGVVILTIYADCPFSTPGQSVERDTFQLLVEIHEP